MQYAAFLRRQAQKTGILCPHAARERAAVDGQRLLALQARAAVGRGGENEMTVHHVHVALAANGLRGAARAVRACARLLHIYKGLGKQN